MLVRVRPNGAAQRDVVRWEADLRRAALPVIARIQDHALLLDLRTVDPGEEAELIETLVSS